MTHKAQCLSIFEVPVILRIDKHHNKHTKNKQSKKYENWHMNSIETRGNCDKQNNNLHVSEHEVLFLNNLKLILKFHKSWT